MLSKRLKEIADLIPKNSKIVNVGTDHALLEIFLAKTKNVFSIGIDISEKCVIKSRENVNNNSVSKFVTIIQNDGLNNIDINDKIITISGLGTNTILKILKNIKGNDLIIQSNNNHYILRKEICKRGYYIYKEKIIYDKRLYIIIYFKKGRKKYSDFDFYIGTNKTNKDYINYILKLNQNELKKIPKKNIIRKYKINSRINKLKKIVDF